MLREGGVSRETVISLVTSNPADHLKLSRKGRVRPGCDGDVLVLDGNFRPLFLAAKGRLLWRKAKSPSGGPSSKKNVIINSPAGGVSPGTAPGPRNRHGCRFQAQLSGRQCAARPAQASTGALPHLYSDCVNTRAPRSCSFLKKSFYPFRDFTKASMRSMPSASTSRDRVQARRT